MNTNFIVLKDLDSNSLVLNIDSIEFITKHKIGNTDCSLIRTKTKCQIPVLDTVNEINNKIQNIQQPNYCPINIPYEDFYKVTC